MHCYFTDRLDFREEEDSHHALYQEINYNNNKKKKKNIRSFYTEKYKRRVA